MFGGDFEFDEVKDLHGGQVSPLGAGGDFKDLNDVPMGTLDGEFMVSPSDVTNIADAAGKAYQTYQQVEGAKDILNALAPYQGGSIPLRMPVQQPQPRYNKKLIIGLAIAGVVLAGIGIWYFTRKKRGRNPGPGRWERFKQMVAGE
jgi:hypothetical protein